MNKISVFRILRISVLTFLFFLVLSIVSSLLLALQIYIQFHNSTLNAQLNNPEGIQNLHRKVKFLNIATSNPFMATGASLFITPGSYGNLSSAIDNANNILGISARYLKDRSSRQESLISLAQPLNNAMPPINKLLDSLSHLHLGGVLTPLDVNLREIRSKSRELKIASESVTPLVSILPRLAGSEKPRKYLLAFQNSAEARGTGGILGAFAVLTTNKGKIAFSQFGSNSSLSQLEDIPVKMPDEYIRLYNDDPGIWQNSNISPHFPYGAKIWLALWKKQFGEELDGVVTFDPIALSYLLNATGAVTANQEEITAKNVVKVTLSDVYKKYETDNESRKKFLINIIKAVSLAIEKGDLSIVELGQNLITPINEHRILLYSADPQEEKIIQKSSISGAISTKPDNLYRLIIQNTSGNKMDYYLKRSLKIESIRCTPVKKTKITFTLINTASPQLKLPKYVMGRLDLQRPQGLNNSYGTRAIILAPVGAQITEAKNLQTAERFGFLVRERGHIGLGVQVDLAAGQSQSFSITFSGGVGKLATHVQPLVIPQKTQIVDRCVS